MKGHVIDLIMFGLLVIVWAFATLTTCNAVLRVIALTICISERIAARRARSSYERNRPAPPPRPGTWAGWRFNQVNRN